MKTLFLSLFLVFTVSIQAQITTGTIEMGITDFKMDAGDQMPEGFDMGEMLKSMKNVMHFKPGLFVQEMTMMGMVNTKTFIVKDSTYQYMDMMGQKWLIKSSTNHINQLGIDIAQIEDLYTVKYDKTDQREILGFKCYRADITMDVETLMKNLDQENEIGETAKNLIGEMKMTVYITDEVDMPMMQLQQFQGLKLEGAPLYVNMEMRIISMTMEATNFSKNVDPNIFNRPDAGAYKLMTIEDLKSMGMGSGGFGF